MDPRSRNTGLDAIRATAVVMVIVFHLAGAFGLPAADVFGLGAFGVDLFFALSGFLIGRIYFEDPDLWDRNAHVFWARRFVRTAPPYLVALILAWFATWVARRQPFDWRYLAFLQNYDHPMPFFLVSWSLCIEEHFYALVAVAMALTGRRGLLAAVVGMVVGSVAARAWTDGAWEFGYATTATHLRLDVLALGFLAAGWKGALLRRTFGGWMFASMALVFLTACLVFTLDTNRYWYGRFVIGLIAVAWVLMSVRAEIGPIGHRVVSFLSRRTYSLYLTHALVLNAIVTVTRGRLDMPLAPKLIVSVCGMLVLGEVFYRLVERPSIRLRDRLSPVPKGGTPAGSRGPFDAGVQDSTAESSVERHNRGASAGEPIVTRNGC